MTGSIREGKLLLFGDLDSDGRHGRPSLHNLRLHSFKSKDQGAAACALAAVRFHWDRPSVRQPNIDDVFSTAKLLADVNSLARPNEDQVALALKEPVAFELRLGEGFGWLAHTLFLGLRPQARHPGHTYAADFSYLRPLCLGHLTFLAILDLYTRYVVAWTVLFRIPRAEDFSQMIDALVLAQIIPINLRTDNGGIFCALQQLSRYAYYGIEHQRTPRGVPQFNGVIEAFFKLFKTNFLPETIPNRKAQKILSSAVHEYCSRRRDCIGSSPSTLAAGVFAKPIYVEI